MIQIKCGTCGTSKGYKTVADGPLSLPAAEEKRLVQRGVAEYMTRPIIGPDMPTVMPAGGSELPGKPEDTPGTDPASEAAAGGEEDGADEVTRLEKLPKADLEAMARDLGVDSSKAKNKHELAVLIAAADEPEDGSVPLGADDGDIIG